MRTGRGSWRGAVLLVGAAFVAWALIPFIALFDELGTSGGVFTGAVGSDAYNQFQYQAWIRDASTHVLSSNLFGMEPAHHDFLHPMYLLSGLLLHTGLDIQWVYLLWRPIALVLLVYAFARYAQRMLPERPWQAIAALVLALFYLTPAFKVSEWLDTYESWGGIDLLIAGRDMSIARVGWGTDHTAIAIALMPLFLLGVESVLREAADGPRRAALSRTALLTAGAGMLSSWLHPAQGGTLFLIAVGVALVSGPLQRRNVALLPIAAASLAPLLYLKILTWTDPSWELAAASSQYPRIPAVPLLLTIAPLAVFSLLGLPRRWPRSDGDRMLLLWPLAAAVIYFVNDQFPVHALGGLSLPLAVLAVRGWARVRERVPVPAVAGAAVVAALTVPGVLNPIEPLKLAIRLGTPLYQLTDREHDAMSYLRDAPDGGVLARPQLSLSVASFTGHPVWAGHGKWTPDSEVRAGEADAFFDGGGDAPAFVRRAGVRYVLADCSASRDLEAALRTVTSDIRRFGCVRVYEVDT